MLNRCIFCFVKSFIYEKLNQITLDQTLTTRKERSQAGFCNRRFDFETLMETKLKFRQTKTFAHKKTFFRLFVRHQSLQRRDKIIVIKHVT